MLTDTEQSFYIYLTLDPNSTAELPFYEQLKAFCAGYVVALRRSQDYDNQIVHMGLGTNAQIERIVSDIRGSSGRLYDPHNPYHVTADAVRSKYGARYFGEYDDADPVKVSPIAVKKGFISGYQTAQYAKHERELPPIDVFAPLPIIWDEKVRIIEDLAAELMNTLSEAA